MITIEQLIDLAAHRGINWRSRWVGLVCSLVLGAIPATSATAILGPSPIAGLAIGIAGTLAGFFAWRLSCRVPRNRPTSIGIALAIRSETEAERKRIRSDFVEEIKASFMRREASAPFNIIEIPSYLSPDPTDTESALRFLREARCHLLIWGGIRTRTKSNAHVYCLHLEGAVTHALIEHRKSKQLAHEMRSAIPQKTTIALADELTGFEAASATLALGSKYVVALAAALSGDRALSIMLMKELLAEVGRRPDKAGRKPKKGPIQELRHRIRETLPGHLSHICLAEYAARTKAWQTEKENLSQLESAEQYLEQHREFSVNSASPSLSYFIAKALLEVTLRANIAEAEKLLLKCRARWIDDPTWRLSLAFVRVLQHRPDDALPLYDSAFAREIPPDTILDIEDYVQWWLSKHDGPPALYLLSAMLNWGWKHDAALAMKDLRQFEVVAGKGDSGLAARCAQVKAEIESDGTGSNGVLSALPLTALRTHGHAA